MENIKVRAHSTIAVIGLIVAIVACVVSISAFSLQVYNTIFNVNDTKAGETAYLEFQAGAENQWGSTFNAKPSAGWFYMRVKQVSGESKATYSLFWKVSTDTSWRTVYMNHAFSKNNVYGNTVMITQSNGRRNYDFWCQKTAGFVKASKLQCDWIIR